MGVHISDAEVLLHDMLRRMLFLFDVDNEARREQPDRPRLRPFRVTDGPTQLLAFGRLPTTGWVSAD